MHNLVIKSLSLASHYHDNQLYGKLPYIEHLLQVLDIIIEYYPDDYILQSSALLHDILEDTSCSYNDIVRNTNKEIADIVYDVTDELGKNRKERKLKTYPKIKSNKNAIIIKLADRLANVIQSIKTSSNLLNMYIKEYPEFKIQLYNTDDDTLELWFKLDSLLII